MRWMTVLPLALLMGATPFVESAVPVEHGIVYFEEGRFAGWPGRVVAPNPFDWQQP